MGELIGLKPNIEDNSPEDLEVQLASRNVYGDLNAINATVVLNHTTGVTLAEDTSLLMPVSTLQDLMALDGVRNVSIYLKDITTILTMKEKLEKTFKEAGLNIDVLPFFDPSIGEFYAGSIGFMMVISLFFICMIYSAGILSLANVVTMNILERTKEIGTMRSLGFDQKNIARIFMKESVIVSIISIVFGNILIFFIAMFINSLNIRILPPYIPGSMRFYLMSNLPIKIAVALPLLLLSAFASYYIAKNKTKKNISHLLSDVMR
jgi:putative ABC transport system permease protein